MTPTPGQRVYILCGLPFAGKTTLARALEERLGIVHIEVDREHLDNWDVPDGEPRPKEAWVASYKVAYARLEETLDAGRSAVFDATGYRRFHRDRARRLAATRGIPSTVIVMDVSREEAQARRDANRRTPVRPNVPDSDFEMVSREMQRPGPEEPSVTYHPSEPVDEWIDRVIRPLGGEPT